MNNLINEKKEAVKKAATKDPAANNSVVKASNNLPTAAAAPDPYGFESLTAADVYTPAIRIAHSNSEVVKQNPLLMNTFYHTTLGISFGKEVYFSVLKFQRRYELRRPEAGGALGELLAFSRDGLYWNTTGKWEVEIAPKQTVVWEIKDLAVANSPLLKYGSFDPADAKSGMAARMLYDYGICLFVDDTCLGLFSMTLGKTAAKKARMALNTVLFNNKSNPDAILAYKIKANIVEDTNKKGIKYSNWNFAVSSSVKFNAEQLELIKQIRETVPLNIDYTQTGEASTADGEDDKTF